MSNTKQLDTDVLPDDWDIDTDPEIQARVNKKLTPEQRAIQDRLAETRHWLGLDKERDPDDLTPAQWKDLDLDTAWREVNQRNQVSTVDTEPPSPVVS